MQPYRNNKYPKTINKWQHRFSKTNNISLKNKNKQNLRIQIEHKFFSSITQDVFFNFDHLKIINFWICPRLFKENLPVNGPSIIESSLALVSASMHLFVRLSVIATPFPFNFFLLLKTKCFTLYLLNLIMMGQGFPPGALGFPNR